MIIDHPSMSACLCHYRIGELEVMKYLVENSSVDINATDARDNTPLDHARKQVYPWQPVLPYYALISVF
jgi:hypothetical protein